MLIVLASVLVGAGTFAYFTDVETSVDNMFEAGTLDVWIKDIDEGWFDDVAVSASWTSPDGWAPGEDFTTDVIWLKNVGDIDAAVVFARFCELSESVEGFAKKIKLASIWDYSSSTGVWYETVFDEDTANAWLAYWGVTEKGYITLWDLVYVANLKGTSAKTGLYFYNAPDPVTGPPELPADGTFGTKATFELMYDTKNEYQGASVTFRIDLIASQYFDKTDIVDNYITEPLGPLTP